MAIKVVQKNISLSDSIVMKEYEKIAVKKNLIERKNVPQIEKKTSNKLSFTGDVFFDAISLASALREKGFNKQAESLEKTALEYKKAQTEKANEYTWWKETGDSFLSDAHKADDFTPIPSSNGYGVVEDELEKHKKILNTLVNPTGKQANIISELNKIAQEYRDPQKKRSEEMSEFLGLVHSVVSKYDQSIGLLRSFPKPGLKFNSENKNNIPAIIQVLGMKEINERLLSMIDYILTKDGNKLLGSLDNACANMEKAIAASEKAPGVPKDKVSLYMAKDSVAVFNSIAEKLGVPNNSIPIGVQDIALVRNNINVVKRTRDILYGEIAKFRQTAQEMSAQKNAAYDKAVSKIHELHRASANLKSIVDKTSADQYLSTEEQASIMEYINDLDKNMQYLNSIRRKDIESFVSYLVAAFPTGAKKYSQILNEFDKDFEYVVSTSETIKADMKEFGGLLNAPIGAVKEVVKGFDGWRGNLAQARAILDKIASDDRLLVDFGTQVNIARDASQKIGQMLDVSGNIDDSNTFGDLIAALRNIEGISKRDAPANPRELLATTGYVLDLANRINQEVYGKKAASIIPRTITKTADLIGNLESVSGGGKPQGPVQTRSPRAPSGGRTTTPAKSQKTKQIIAMMQQRCVEFASYMYNRSEGDPKMKELAAEVMNTAKKQFQGANPDGVWGDNTKNALTAAKKYIETDPDLKSISAPIMSQYPAGESDANIISIAEKNISYLNKALALAGNPLYTKYLDIGDLIYDRLPKTIEDNLLEAEVNFIPLKSENLVNLYVLKRYLEANGFEAGGV